MMTPEIIKLEEASRVLDQVGELSMRFSRIYRLPRYSDGIHENDSEHSHMLAMLCIELAMRFHPELDLGRITLLATVHDLDEVEAEGGDTPSLYLTNKTLAAKKDGEHVGRERLKAKYPFASNLFDLMDGYKPEEDFNDDPAAFVFIIDKLTPFIFHNSNDFEVLIEQGITSGNELWRSVEVTTARIEPFRPKFPLIIALRDYRLQRDADSLDAMNLVKSSDTISR